MAAKTWAWNATTVLPGLLVHGHGRQELLAKGWKVPADALLQVLLQRPIHGGPSGSFAALHGGPYGSLVSRHSGPFLSRVSLAEVFYYFQPRFNGELAADAGCLQVLIEGVRALAPFLENSSLADEWEVQDLPNSMQRLELYEGEHFSIAIQHLDADDLLVHNHRRSFYSYCLAGSYRHRVFKIELTPEGTDETTNSKKWFGCTRQPKGRFSPAKPLDVSLHPLLDCYFDQGNIYCISSETYHQVDQVVGADSKGAITIVIKPSNSSKQANCKSSFYFDDLAADPNKREGSGHTTFLLGEAKRKTLDIFANALKALPQTISFNEPSRTIARSLQGERIDSSKLDDCLSMMYGNDTTFNAASRKMANDMILRERENRRCRLLVATLAHVPCRDEVLWKAAIWHFIIYYRKILMFLGQPTP